MKHKTVLITGGTGYIGSHIACELVHDCEKIILLDNLSNSHGKVVKDIETIVNKKIEFVACDINDFKGLNSLFSENNIDTVIHCAAHKSTEQSLEQPLNYYINNISGTLNLLKTMEHHKSYTLIFSSSATVYGEPMYLPIDEKHPTKPVNPYGKSKLNIEEILQDLSRSNPQWRIASLRYFNPAGAHESGMIGDNPSNPANNLMPKLLNAASQRVELALFGNDYDTSDGTCVRDYIHVTDVAEGHIAALNFLQTNHGWHVFNLGSGSGYSVLELINTCESIFETKIPYFISERRPGDLAMNLANINKAKLNLNWAPKKGLPEICQSAWKYFKTQLLENETF